MTSEAGMPCVATGTSFCVCTLPEFGAPAAAGVDIGALADDFCAEFLGRMPDRLGEKFILRVGAFDHEPARPLLSDEVLREAVVEPV